MATLGYMGECTGIRSHGRGRLSRWQGCSQFEPRDKRFYHRAFLEFCLREDLAELDSEFNGVDFGRQSGTRIFC